MYCLLFLLKVRRGVMPAIAAHYYFGQAVQKQLPSSIAQIIEKHENLFILGCQGPDLLFFTKPVTGKRFHKLGSAIHRAPGRVFFETNLKLYTTTKNESLLVYLLGCICHFWLDKSCHPFVYENAPEMSQHHRLESELDSLVIAYHQLDTSKHRLIPVTDIDFSAVAMAYNITPKEAKRAAKDFRRISGMLQHKKAVQLLEGIAGQKGALSGLSPHKDIVFGEDRQTLYGMLQDNIFSCAVLIEKVVAGLEANLPLPEQFNFNFEGKLHENDQT